MGFLDDIVKAVQSGTLEHSLKQVADGVDAASQQLDKTLKNAADRPETVLETAKQKTAEVSQQVENGAQHIVKQADAIRKKV
jgi:exonuclease VII small subunit